MSDVEDVGPTLRMIEETHVGLSKEASIDYVPRMSTDTLNSVTSISPALYPPSVAP